MKYNDLHIIIHSSKDSLGRQSFSAEWMANNVGPSLNETGVRSQIFFGILDEFIKSRESIGKHITIIPENQSLLGYVLKNNKWVKYDVKTWQPIG